MFLPSKGTVQSLASRLRQESWTHADTEQSRASKYMSSEEAGEDSWSEWSLDIGIGDNANDNVGTIFSSTAFGDGDLDVENSLGMHICVMHANLSASEQMHILQYKEKWPRLCVIATNIAEASLTIPSIRYVVDSGKVKQRYDDNAGIPSYRVEWTSKASAVQRSGRAARHSSGHCYRLYSSAVFEHSFPQHVEPEILRVSLEGSRPKT